MEPQQEDARTLLRLAKRAIVATLRVNPVEGMKLLAVAEGLADDIRFDAGHIDTDGPANHVNGTPSVKPGQAVSNDGAADVSPVTHLPEQTKGDKSLTTDYLILRALVDGGGRAEGLDAIQSLVAKIYPDLGKEKGRSHIITKISRLRNERNSIARQQDRLDRSYAITEDGRVYAKKLEDAYLKRGILDKIKQILAT